MRDRRRARLRRPRDRAVHARRDPPHRIDAAEATRDPPRRRIDRPRRHRPALAARPARPACRWPTPTPRCGRERSGRDAPDRPVRRARRQRARARLAQAASDRAGRDARDGAGPPARRFSPTPPASPQAHGVIYCVEPLGARRDDADQHGRRSGRDGARSIGPALQDDDRLQRRRRDRAQRCPR